MRTGTAIALSGAAGVLVLMGLQYKRNAENLQYALSGIQVMNNGNIYATIAVLNQSRFAYPVPAMSFGVFDSQDKYLGTLQSNELQWINKAGISYLKAWIKPDYLQLISLLTNVLNGAALEFTLTGYIQVNTFRIPVETNLQLANNGI